MKALHCWLLTEGAHGMISQVEGLAKSLNTTFDHHTIDLPVLFKFLPPFLTPKIQQCFNFNQIVKDDSLAPDIIISCGRKSVIPNIVLKKYFKKKFNKDLKNIHIQDPKISPKNFDFIITPQHDNKINSENIIRSVGALHYLNEEEVINKNNGENVITFILGGPNKYYNFKKEDLEVHFEKIDNNIFAAGCYNGSGIGVGTLFGEQIAIKASEENTKEIETIEAINKPTWLPPQPFLNLGVKTRLIYERLRARSEI